MKKFLLIFFFVMIFAFPLDVNSAYNYDYMGNAVPSQAGYTVENVRYFGMNEPQDIFFSGENFYIADTGNSRILVLDFNLENIIKIYDKFILPDGTETELKNPEGIYVSGEKIYIADTGNSRVIISDFNSQIITQIEKPVSEIYDQNKTFLPEKIIADKSGNVYIISENIATGCMMFDKNSDFTGFFGANSSERTAENIRNYFTSGKKKSHRKRNIPAGINNFDISEDFIFTCTENSEKTSDIIKKLNPAGKNIFLKRNLHFGDYQPKYSDSGYKPPKIADIDISENGNINFIDSETGHIFQYDKNCKLLFITGEISGKKGDFEKPTAIETANNKIYILDSAKNNITIFSETKFGEKVHNAVELYNAGYYAETLGLWLEIAGLDSNYTYAYNGLGYAFLRNGEYKNSMKYAKLSGDSELYNKAFQEYRRIFLKENSGKILLIIFAISAIIIIKRRGEKS